MEIKTTDEYIEQLPEERKEAISKLRDIIRQNIPDGFEETMNYGMIGFVVPHSLYPPGYHVDPRLPLPFINIASQKSHIALYHSGIYTIDELHDWFTEEYAKQSKTKLNMGKSCIRFKKPEHIPYDLIAELATKITPEQWIKTYENKNQ
jgi:uncharacterized protein YdhG (YjbR/CyaY superfamily)